MGGKEMTEVLVRKNLNRWFKEKWVDVSRKDKDGKHPPCGRSKAKKDSKGYPKCRPSVKVSSKTPTPVPIVVLSKSAMPAPSSFGPTPTGTLSLTPGTILYTGA